MFMEFISNYVAKQPDDRGFVNYSIEENAVWQILYERQHDIIQNRACEEFIAGLGRLKLTPYGIPQLPEVNLELSKLTGWIVVPVAALISPREFFTLLANRKFPAATFIRDRKSLNYVQEPDIFHELFGHCPMLTEIVYANFLQDYAKAVLDFPEKDWPLLQRLFWYTVEFGLIRLSNGQYRAYGGGILSSIEETPFCLESSEALRIDFDPLAALRMPYRIDRMQTTYFVIDDYQHLYKILERDLESLIADARKLGEYPALFPLDGNQVNIHINAC
jgi:phenylalanine-4-hydroxylase